MEEVIYKESDTNIQGENTLGQEMEYLVESNEEQHTNEGSHKRGREKSENEEDEWEWTVKKKEKKVKVSTDKLEIYVSHKEKLPKQFGLAKLLKENDIKGLTSIKYLNSYKIRIEFDCELNVERFMKCEAFSKMG